MEGNIIVQSLLSVATGRPGITIVLYLLFKEGGDGALLLFSGIHEY